jgi:hypothetical protein
MTRNDFRELFIRALESAAEHAEATLKHPIPRSFLIELHGPRSVGQAMSIDEALDQIYLGNNRFCRIIDVAIKRSLQKQSLAFVRVSGHSPVDFQKTWDPATPGPFKQISAETIDDRRVPTA